MNSKAQKRRSRATFRPTPAFLTGTSSEYLGRRPLPTVLRRRPLIVLLGPEGVGKTSVAQRICSGEGRRLGTRELENAVIARVSTGAWAEELVRAPFLTLDGPVWLQNRPAVVSVLLELLRQRMQAGRQSIVCQRDTDGSAALLMEAMAPGEMVVLGLRFPKGRRGRLAFARRICDQFGLSRIAAQGTEELQPWGYAKVIQYLKGYERGVQAHQGEGLGSLSPT